MFLLTCSPCSSESFWVRRSFCAPSNSQGICLPGTTVQYPLNFQHPWCPVARASSIKLYVSWKTASFSLHSEIPIYWLCIRPTSSHMGTCIVLVLQTLPGCAGRQDVQFFYLHSMESNPFFILDLLACNCINGIIQKFTFQQLLTVLFMINCLIIYIIIYIIIAVLFLFCPVREARGRYITESCPPNGEECFTTFLWWHFNDQQNLWLKFTQTYLIQKFKILHSILHFSWYFAKPKIQKISKQKISFLPLLLTAGCCEEELYLACTRGIGVWAKETLVVYLIRIWQPSHFLCYLPLILCQFYLRFPYQLTSAMPFVF